MQKDPTCIPPDLDMSLLCGNCQKKHFLKVCFWLQMLKYVQEDNSTLISTRIVVTDTDVQHSGTYKCEPGDAPIASVSVHVLDGKFLFAFILPHFASTLINFLTKNVVMQRNFG